MQAAQQHWRKWVWLSCSGCWRRLLEGWAGRAMQWGGHILTLGPLAVTHLYRSTAAETGQVNAWGGCYLPSPFCQGRGRSGAGKESRGWGGGLV